MHEEISIIKDKYWKKVKARKFTEPDERRFLILIVIYEFNIQIRNKEVSAIQKNIKSHNTRSAFCVCLKCLWASPAHTQRQRILKDIEKYFVLN